MMNSNSENHLFKKINRIIPKRNHLLLIVCGLIVFLSLHLRNKIALQEKGYTHSKAEFESPNTKTSFPFSKLFKISSDGNLDVLEIPHLKEQIERDLTSFNFIESAKVAAFFNENNPELSKISLIISPKHENKNLTPPEINSIVHYLQGTFGQLNREMISISDHNGFSYSIIEQGSEQISQNTMNHTILDLISSHFKGLVPLKHCLFNVQTKLNSEKETEAHLQITLNSEFLKKFSANSGEMLIKNLREKSNTLISEKGAIPFVSVEVIPFLLEDNMESYVRLIPRWMVITIYLMISGIFVMTAYYYLFRKTADTESIFYPMTPDKKQTNLKRLADLLSRQEPKKIALMLSYLTPARSGELKALLPEDLKNLLNEENQ